jgi:hypothetical protein
LRRSDVFVAGARENAEREGKQQGCA